MNKAELEIKEVTKFYNRILLPNQDPEVVLSALDSLPRDIDPDEFEYDPETSELMFKDVSDYLTYSDYLWRFHKEKFDLLAESPLQVIYGEEEKIKSTVPFMWSTEWGKNPRVKLGKGESNTYVVSNRGRDKNRMNLVDTMIFPETLQNPLEMDDLVNKAYRSSARIKYGDYIRAFQIPYHLGAFPEITEDVRFIQDLSKQRLKYKLNSWSDYIAFGPDGWSSDFASLPIRAVQWQDSLDEFGIWIKPGNYYGSTELPFGKPVLINGKYSNPEDYSFYLFSNNYGILYLNSDPRFAYLKTDLNPWYIRSKYGDDYGVYDQILYNERGWKKPKTQRKGTPRLPIYDIEEVLHDSCPEFKNISFTSLGIDNGIRRYTEWLFESYCYLGFIEGFEKKGKEFKSIDKLKYIAKLII